jgi:glucose 1-dehydrogenase
MEMNKNLLQGKTAVITGGTRGLGLAIARGMAAEGAAVVLGSRSAGSVEKAVAALQAEGFQAAGIAVDVADLEQIEALRDLALDKFDRLDIWVNNAGIGGPYGPTVEFLPEEFYQVVQTNILGVYNGSRTAVRHFQQVGSGKLINILGHGANGPVTWQNAYSASKGWVKSFTRALAAETKEQGIGVFAYQPGMVLTELLTDIEVIAGHEAKLKSFGTIVRLLAKTPQAAAQGAVRLATQATDGKTGLVVAGASGPMMLARFANEGLHRLVGKPSQPVEIHTTSVPPADH